MDFHELKGGVKMDYVHMSVSILQKYTAAQVVGDVKGKSAT